ncbi:TIGR04282 family arsenosugar biosynthesis glycosyltransferase [Halomonas sp. BN3-1]|uniref:TIGR04282 family arsenosugar biosynthesis glycosyltransferase n=1 Tax=unclassified Halomonas TaxID=2609666 RepID=UPI001F05A297|nr:TIGR04282 family arsenosugar biosynthesis glycosyltransferase [Halomonas sp. BN3-1]
MCADHDSDGMAASPDLANSQSHSQACGQGLGDQHRVHHEDGLKLAILAKASIPGQAKTRMIPALGAEGAARLQHRLIEYTLKTALETTSARNITLWTALEHDHPCFVDIRQRFGVTLRPQPEGDLGVRMHAALCSAGGPSLLIGTDCPILDKTLLKTCHKRLKDADSVFLPAEDGGYALVGVRRPDPRLFRGIDWGTSSVMSQTRTRLAELLWTLECPTTVWDLDTPQDLARLADMEALALEILP